MAVQRIKVPSSSGPSSSKKTIGMLDPSRCRHYNPTKPQK